MSSSDFDLSQFYTRRNSNYNIVEEVTREEQSSSTSSIKNLDNNKSHEGAIQAVANNEEPQTEYCGFLFSVSKDETGEYWPLKIGRNTIGSSCQDDIVLNQQSVTAKHAILNAERQTGKLIMKVIGNGYVQVNGLEITDETVCRDRDILTIGNVYQLLLLFVDKEKYGLKKIENFKEEILTLNKPKEENFPQPEEEGTVFLQ